MEPEKITIPAALNQVKQWFEIKDYDKVILGCQEILKVDPENQEAREFLKQSEELKKTENIKFPEFPLPTMTSQEQNSQEEKKEGSELEPEPQETTKHFLGYLIRKIATIVIIFAILTGIGVGGYYGYQYYIKPQRPIKEPGPMQNTDVITEVEDTENEEEEEPENTLDESIKQNNEKRNQNLELLKKALESYYIDTGQYPSIESVEEELIQGSYLEEIPFDPRHGEKDEKGIDFGYTYAVYPNASGENQEYIIAANYENSEKEDNIWSPNPTTLHPDFHDLDKENVKILEADKNVLDEPSDETEPSDENDVLIPEPTKRKVRRI